MGVGGGRGQPQSRQVHLADRRSYTSTPSSRKSQGVVGHSQAQAARPPCDGPGGRDKSGFKASVALKKTSLEARNRSHGLCRRLALRLGPLGSVAEDSATHPALPASAALPWPLQTPHHPHGPPPAAGDRQRLAGAVTFHSVIFDSGAWGQKSRTLKILSGSFRSQGRKVNRPPVARRLGAEQP